MRLGKRRDFNPKRQIADRADAASTTALASRVHYKGSPVHKRNPGDFNLTPPSQPRPDKTLCDATGIVVRAEAEALLKEGVRRGLVSRQIRGDFPLNIWAVSAAGVALEAELDNATQGSYHGYPMTRTDPFTEAVLRRWAEQ